MAGEEGKRDDLYGVLGLNKECSASELRSAYKKLALKWHPDRCSARGNSKSVEEAKKKFQAIQQAYSVLSDSNKRFLYDVGVYDFDDDDDENGMGDFLNEMAAMMNDNRSNEQQGESFEELQGLFEEMLQNSANLVDTSSFSSTPSPSCGESCYFDNISTKRSSSEFDGFCMGDRRRRNTPRRQGRGVGGRRTPGRSNYY